MDTPAFEKVIISVLREYDTIPDKIFLSVGTYVSKLNKHIRSLHEYLISFNTSKPTPTAKVIYTMTTDIIQNMKNRMVRNFNAYCKYIRLRSDGPWSVVMVLFCLMSNLVVIVEDVRDAFGSDKEPWRCEAPATDLPYILNGNMCVSRSCIKSYTVDELRAALYLIALHWHGLSAHVELTRYMNALLHRACMLVSHPSYLKVMNNTQLCSPLQTVSKGQAASTAISNDTQLYRVNYNGVRFFSMQLIRMFVTIDIAHRLQIEDTVGTFYGNDAASAVTDITNIRTFIYDQVDVIADSNEMRSELTGSFSRLVVMHGDSETFINSRGLENARPQTVLMTVRPETQEAYSVLHQFLLYKKMAELTKEEEPDYFQRWTRAEHAYTVLLKLIMVNMPLKETGVDFFKDFVCYDIDLPHHINNIIEMREPKVIQLFGRMHVTFEGKLYMCTCIEQAIAVWMRVVISKLQGTLSRVRISDKLSMMLGISLDAQTPQRNTFATNNTSDAITKKYVNVTDGDVIID